MANMKEIRRRNAEAKKSNAKRKNGGTPSGLERSSAGIAKKPKKK